MLSLILIWNCQELFIRMYMYVNLFTFFISHYYSLSLSIYAEEEQKNSFISGCGYLEQGKLQHCVRSSDEKSLWINAKIYHTSLIYRNLLKPWPELDARLGPGRAGFINNCNRLTRALSINGISFENLFRYLSLAVEQFRDRNLSITSLFVRFGWVWKINNIRCFNGWEWGRANNRHDNCPACIV